MSCPWKKTNEVEERRSRLLVSISLPNNPLSSLLSPLSSKPPLEHLADLFIYGQHASRRTSEPSEHSNPSFSGTSLPPKLSSSPFSPSLFQVAPPSPKPTASQKALAAAFLAHQVEELQNRVDGMNMRGRGRGGGPRGGGRGGRGGRGDATLDAGFG